MDLFELLFIALFIIFPILEGVLRQRKKGRGGEEIEDESADAGWSEPGPEPRSASDMVPDDLWEVMTGERRQRDTPDAATDTGSAGSAPWSVDPDEAPAAGDAVASEEPQTDLGGWESEPWMDDSSASREPVSLEYEGPEAYTLETPAPKPIEREVPTSEARHRAFHRLIDKPKAKRKRRMSPLIRSLRSPDGLRQAVLLKEVLGPPKGLE